MSILSSLVYLLVSDWTTDYWAYFYKNQQVRSLYWTKSFNFWLAYIKKYIQDQENADRFERRDRDQ